MRSYITFYVGEVRAVTLYLRDQEDVDFVASSASTFVDWASGGNLIPEVPAMISGSSLTCLVDTRVTVNKGVYCIIWKIIQGQYTYYHRTDINVVELE